MSDAQKNIVFRYVCIIALITLGFLAVLTKIIYIQYIERDKWLAIADKQVATYQPIKATRGNIMDCDGRLLASSMPQYNIYIDTRVPALREENGQLFYQELNALCEGLSRIVGGSTETYKTMITKAYQRKSARLRLSKQPINYLQKRRLETEVPLIKMGRYKGVFFENRHERIKPFGNLASRTIGSIYREGGYGNSGLEKEFEKILRGHDGVSARQKIGGRYENVTIEEAEDGLDVITTIDAHMQDYVEQALREPLQQFNAEWGCCILMETQTGEIKAIANLDRTSNGNYIERFNHAVTRVEPGSTFKPIALMAALDDGKVEINDTVEVYKNGWRYFNATHRDAHPMDTIYTIRSALAASSNIAMAKIITLAYEGSAKKFVKRIQRIGLCDSIYCEIPGAQQPWIAVPQDTVTLSKMAYGYSVLLTPMQQLMFYNAIANDGKMIRPMLVKEIQKNGETIERFNTKVVKQSICSSSTLRDIQGALHDVVWDNQLGTASVRKWKQYIVGKKAQSDLVHIAGKTGTAQLLINGKYTGRRHRISFVGYFPEDNPQYTCICVINDPQHYGYDAGMDCGKVVRKIAEKTMAHQGYYTQDDTGTLTLEIKN